MNPNLDWATEASDDLAGLFEPPEANDRPGRQIARRTLERMMEERALRQHLQDDFDLDPSDTAMDW